MASLKVLFVHNHYQLRSGEAEVYELDRRAAQLAGHEVISYTRDNRELDEYGPLQRISLAARTTWAWDSQRALSRIIARERPALAHFVNTLPLISPAAFWTCQRHGVPVVYNVQNYRLACPAATFLRDGVVCTECPERGLWRAVLHGCYRDSRAASLAVAAATQAHRSIGTFAHAVDRFLVPSAFMAQTLVRHAGLDPHKLVVKPNSVSPDPGPRARAGDYLLYAGRLTPEKGVLTLLDAYAELPGAPVLHIVGDGPLRAQLAARLANDPRLARVALLGALPHAQTVAHIRGALALIVPSTWYEGVPLSLLEAFACATPVLAARIGSLAEVVHAHDNGLLFEPGNAVDLRRALTELLDDPQRAAALGASGRATFEASHTLEHNAQALDAIYRDVLKNQRKESRGAGE
jgi:glycosyltransferase involved in cell wall biosynthesis